ncbi:MAG: CTP synthase [Coriobacteriia bacterium]|nr:CTP synthase [Coriobacteriia bacterium]
MAKHIFITGGVVSSLGKGITAASIGHLLKARGYKVTMQKADPYLNVDPGTMSPFQHGEVFITDDGHEGDLDLGHYERFIDENLSRDSNFTAGVIYQSLIMRERRGDFQGGTVQVIPHMTNAIKDRLTRIAEQSNADIVITEIGGTVGDIESLPFIEAARQFKMAKAPGDVLFIHVTLVPYIPAAHEVKTKPTQHSVKELRSIGVQPDFIVCRSDHDIEQNVREKIALFCDVKVDNVLSCVDETSIYRVPLNFQKQDFDIKILNALGLGVKSIDMRGWDAYIARMEKPAGEPVDIAIVGKYVSLPDAYLSITEALHHSGVFHGRRLAIHLIDAETVRNGDAEKILHSMDGILVPGGFDLLAFEGKIAAIKYARVSKTPFFGICLGFQAAVCEFARNVVGLEGACSTEFSDDIRRTTGKELQYPVIDTMPELEDIAGKDGSIRLGAYPCKIKDKTLTMAAYDEPLIYERHCNRYEVNNAFRDRLTNAGLVISGLSPDERLVEFIELPDHPWFVACQAHPEFKSRPTRCHPLFRDFVHAAINYRDAKGN